MVSMQFLLHTPPVSCSELVAAAPPNSTPIPKIFLSFSIRHLRFFLIACGRLLRLLRWGHFQLLSQQLSTFDYEGSERGRRMMRRHANLLIIIQLYFFFLSWLCLSSRASNLCNEKGGFSYHGNFWILITIYFCSLQNVRLSHAGVGNPLGSPLMGGVVIIWALSKWKLTSALVFLPFYSAVPSFIPFLFLSLNFPCIGLVTT